MQADQTLTTNNDGIDTQLTPEYADTTTSPVKWYGYNLAMFALSLVMVLFSIALLEYEIARITSPEVAFIATPMVFDITIATIVGLLGLANLSVLLFVFLRHLWSRHWMVATTLVGWMLIAVTVLVLQDSFLPVIFPNLPL
jgi:hypothetical protein